MSSSIRLRPGARLGPYQIEDLAGEGAMGRVYRAIDPRLGRAVALKVLPEEFLNQRQHLERFEREAKAASRLNHPNIVTVYEVGEELLAGEEDDRSREARPVPFIAMEFIEGRSLRSVLEEGPLSVKTAIGLAIQAAEALTRAHEAGIIHRDLKPDNLMVRGDGYLKILDFGLARMTPLPTHASRAQTYDGGYFVVGTAAYMSPEQARGKTVDGRSDIFSLGIVLYQLLSGALPFPGESAVDILSAILHDDPFPLTTMAPNVPRDLARVVERCLEKDPEERFQSMRDLALELKSIRRDIEAGRISYTTGSSRIRARPRSGARPGLLLGLGALGFAALAGSFWIRWKAASPTVRIRRITTSGRASSPVISPNGSLIAYVEDGESSRLVVQQTGSNAALPIDTAGLLPSAPAFSADGEFLYYSAVSSSTGPSIFRSPVLGGTPQRIVAGFRPHPSPDGSWLAFLRNEPGPHPDLALCVSTPDGDRIRCGRAAPASRDFFAFGWEPRADPLLPVVHTRFTTETSRLGRFDRTTGRVRYPKDDGGRLGVIVDGFVPAPGSRGAMYLTGSRIWGRGGDVLLYAHRRLEPITQGNSDFRGVSIDRAGKTVVTADFQENAGVYVTDLTGDPSADSARLRRLTNDREGDLRALWSPDGSRIAFVSMRTHHRSLWLMAADGSSPRELAPDGADCAWPAWSPDGRLITFASNRTGNHEIYGFNLQDGTRRRLTVSTVFNGQTAWTPNGKAIYFESTNAAGNPILKRISAGGGPPVVVEDSDFEDPTVSPDGRYLAATRAAEIGDEVEYRVLRLTDDRVIFTGRTSRDARVLTWMPDSRSLVTLERDERGRENVFARPIDGGRPVALTDLPPDWRVMAPAVDSTGRHLLLMRLFRNSDIVAIGPLRGPTFAEWLGID